MATDFYERQDAARRSTKWLVVMFLLGVIAIVGATMLVGLMAVKMAGESSLDSSGRLNSPLGVSQEAIVVSLMAGGAALALIVGGSLFKTAQLSGGGNVVAENLGGRRVFPDTTDAVERRLLNVVEEMALASGVPVPPVFLLADEEGINAFAAGYSP